MYHVSAQGIDERMINVHYYYYLCTVSFDLSQHRSALRCSLFSLQKLLSNAAEPRGKGSASADGLCSGREGRVSQGRSEAIEISDGWEWCDGLGKILFKRETCH